MLRFDFIVVDNCHWMGPMQMLYFMMTYIFKLKLFKWLFWHVKAGSMQTLLLPSDSESGICHQMSSLGMLYIMTLTYISRLYIFNVSQKGESLRKMRKMPSMNLIEVDIWHQMGPLWMLYFITWPQFSWSQIWNLDILE